MIRFLLGLMFFALLAADALNLDRGLAPGLSIKNAFLYLILVVIGFEAVVARNRRIELLSVIVPYSLYFLYAALSVVIIAIFIQYPTYRPLSSLISLKGGIADHLVVLIAFFYGVLTIKDARSLWKMMIWIVMVANIITVVDSLNIPDLGLVGEREDGRIGGPIGEANQYAVFIALFLPGGVALVLLEQGVRRWLAAIGLAATIIALLMTVSRGGFVGIFVGAIIGAFALRRYVSSKAVLTTVGGAIAAILFATAITFLAGYGDLLYQRVVGLSTSGNNFDVSSGRTVIWSRALGKMLESPVTLFTGFGWDSYRQFRDFGFAPHNSYLKIYFETGIVGIFLVFLALGSVYRIVNSVMPLCDAETRKIFASFVLGLSGALVAIFFVDIVSLFLFIWAYIGVVMRLSVEFLRAKTQALAQGRATNNWASNTEVL